MNSMNDSHPILLCFDGSADASAAIPKAAELIGPRAAVVLNVWEPAATWVPYDPATILSAPLDRLASHGVGVDEIIEEIANETVKDGVAHAQRAGFAAEGRVAQGKPWRIICAVGEELDADLVVLGARGLSRVQSALLGSVSSAVLAHAKRPVLVIPRPAPAK